MRHVAQPEFVSSVVSDTAGPILTAPVAIPATVRNFMCVCPTHRDQRELALVGHAALHSHDYASLALEDLTAAELPGRIEVPSAAREVEGLLAYCRANEIAAIASTDDYPGSLLAAIIADELGLPGMTPTANLLCQHKFLSRQIQAKAVPEAVPEFHLIDVDASATARPPLPLPFFVKPVKSFFSVGAQRVDNLPQLREAQRHWAERIAFFRPFDELLRRYLEPPWGKGWLLTEGLLEGKQVTLDGFVWRGEVHTIGVVDSIMFPGTIAFERFEYPSALPTAVQARMVAIAGRVLPALGVDHGQFNIEFIYNPERDSVHIVEINPRMSSQFADIFEKVDGINSYSILLDLAFGRRPTIRRRQGRHRAAFSCVLRRFSNAFLRRAPLPDQIAALEAQYPDLRIEILATEGLKLSQQMQDTCSYRYGVINIGASSREEALAIFDECQRRLTFDFVPV